MMIKNDLTKEEVLKRVDLTVGRICNKCEFKRESPECIYANECAGAECIGFELIKILVDK